MARPRHRPSRRPSSPVGRSAQPPVIPGLTPLTFEGDLCDLVTAQDLKKEMGSRFQVAAHDATQCTYTGGTAGSQDYVSVVLLDMALSLMRTKGTSDVTVAGRPALLIPSSGALMVDIGAGG